VKFKVLVRAPVVAVVGKFVLMAVAVETVVCSVVALTKVVSASVVLLAIEVKFKVLVTVPLVMVVGKLVLIGVAVETVVCSVIELPKDV
jgi:hypothetical protein